MLDRDVKEKGKESSTGNDNERESSSSDSDFRLLKQVCALFKDSESSVRSNLLNRFCGFLALVDPVHVKSTVFPAVVHLQNDSNN